MKLIFKKSFLKQYQKLNKANQTKVNESLLLFEKNPLDPNLKNHITVIMLGVGTHSQVY